MGPPRFHTRTLKRTHQGKHRYPAKRKHIILPDTLSKPHEGNYSTNKHATNQKNRRLLEVTLITAMQSRLHGLLLSPHTHYRLTYRYSQLDLPLNSYYSQRTILTSGSSKPTLDQHSSRQPLDTLNYQGHPQLRTVLLSRF